MEAIIREKLKEIEENEQVEIILAVESGSRAWGFESPDSDYDVRFIYIRKPEYYLRLDETRDVIEWQLDETLDINGWDLQKALRLLYKSNSTLLEWCTSPIVYYQNEKIEILKKILVNYFSGKKNLYHYWHMASSTYNQFLQGEDVKIKKYFYTLRPLLASKWIVNRNTFPPMRFNELVAAELDDSMLPYVQELLEKKANLDELDYIPRIDKLNDYIAKNLLTLEVKAQMLFDEKNSWEELNKVFLELVLN
ncbi:nucleotidyltransferase [Floricoccus tropicus]|uniref:Nucleotidyltransferase n=1 Tax=Floricoccus tropicus TaxID=1859473 RepID=A0A1E8GQK6_9LACT|nr:nucleotidyltransferase domain-containing protein [Floricoccus tropicus]OFI50540.1 nucleotidyltransferase [Floricoccus tropicus]